MKVSSAIVRLNLCTAQEAERKAMNTIIYIVGLVVIIGVILSYFGLR